MLDATPLLRAYARSRVSRLDRLDAVRAQERTLLRLCREAAGTLFGREHRLAEVASVADFQTRVPVRSYDQMRSEVWGDVFPRIDGISWPEPTREFAITSGTSTGNRKLVPEPKALMRSHMRSITDLFSFYLAATPRSRLFAGPNLVLLGATDLTEIAPGIIAGDLTGLGDRHTPWLVRPWRFTPRSVEMIDGWEARINRLAEAAVASDIRSISGYPSWLIFFFARLAEAAGRIGEPLSALMPSLELVIHGGVDFTSYRPIFDRLLAGSKAALRETYAASEAFVAADDSSGAHGMRLLADHGVFYEFVPLAEAGRRWPARRWIGDVELGVDYALVLSNSGGLWGYALGDVVRFTDRDPPRLIIAGRVERDLSAFGEHVREAELSKALGDAAAGLGYGVADFTVHAVPPDVDKVAGRHRYLVEFEPSLSSREAIADIARRADTRLQELNDNYRVYRAHDLVIEPPEFVSLAAGTFNDWMRRSGRLGGQNKFPRIMSHEQASDKAFQEFVSQRTVAVR